MQRGLIETPGVLEATVDWESGRAEVIYNPNLTAPSEILRSKVFVDERLVEVDDRLIRHRYKATLEEESNTILE